MHVHEHHSTSSASFDYHRNNKNRETGAKLSSETERSWQVGFGLTSFENTRSESMAGLSIQRSLDPSIPLTRRATDNSFMPLPRLNRRLAVIEATSRVGSLRAITFVCSDQRWELILPSCGPANPPAPLRFLGTRFDLSSGYGYNHRPSSTSDAVFSPLPLPPACLARYTFCSSRESLEVLMFQVWRASKGKYIFTRSFYLVSDIWWIVAWLIKSAIFWFRFVPPWWNFLSRLGDFASSEGWSFFLFLWSILLPLPF